MNFSTISSMFGINPKNFSKLYLPNYIFAYLIRI